MFTSSTQLYWRLCRGVFLLSNEQRVRRLFLLTLALIGLSLQPARAIVDLNGNGMSDVWEQFYQAQGVASNIDSDGDGQSNLEESIAGTNPFDSKSVTKLSSVSISGGMVTLSWSSTSNQRFQVQSSADMTNWQDLGTAFVGTGQTMTASFGLPANATFFRVVVSNLDSDGDGVSDWEESIAGFNPHLAYSNGGTTDDRTALQNALQATANTISVVASDPYAQRLGGDTGMFTITRTGKLDAIAVNYTISGSAVAGTDYVSLAGTVSFPFGVNAVNVIVTPKSDAAPSSTARTIIMTLSAGSGYTIGSPNNATVTLARKRAQIRCCRKFG